MSPLTTWTEGRLRRVGWATWLLHTAVVLAGVGIDVVAPSSPTNPEWGSGAFALEIAFLLTVFSFPCVGMLVVHRKPRNRMGWVLLLGVGGALTATGVVDGYTLYALTVPSDPLPGGAVAGALAESGWVWVIGGIGIFVVLLFPDGRLPSPSWRWLPWLALATMTALAVVITLGVEELSVGPVPGTDNPLHLAGAQPLLDAALPVVLPLMPVCIAAAAVALAMRFRRSTGVERQQLTWLAEAGVLVAASYVTAMVAQLFKPDGFSGEDPGWLLVLQNLSLASFALLPLAIGIAILRHRLYDIDRILNRTVVYAALTAALVATYLASVLVFRLLLDPLVGRSELAVAGSTLAVAALFRPVRDRIQGAVDRRFYRRKYDATRAVEAFAGRLRHEVDLDSVSADLRLVVRDTVQPAHLSLWLRESA